MPLLARSTTTGPRRRALVLALLLLVPLFLILLHLTSSPSPRPLPAPRKPSSRSQACDYSAGEWVRDPLASSSLRYDHTCKEIFKGWNCIANGKPNARDLLSWRWRPVGPGCELPRLDPRRFLEHLRDTSIGNFPVPVSLSSKNA
ncbi:Protein trichome birefringence-like 13 [Zea mays]|uniref:Protein trichome birefringence-like 13 n=1 Tax=Zea mays TaxID=4577 RepID=A0A3L6FXE7_MAIZE|nr:Protein trichome birefringence-like 13 [Zea mays]